MNLPNKESIHTEFKSERSGPIDDSVIVNNVVAFSNTDGGTLYLGVEDDGTPTGVDRRHANIDQLAAFVFNNTVPPVQVRAAVVRTDDGVPVVTISVDPSHQLTCNKGGRVIRRALKANGEPEIVTMYPYEFISRLSTIGQYDYSDQPAPDSSLSDLDPAARDLLRESMARTHSDDTILELSDSEFDGALGLITRQTNDGEPLPTVAGILMIGTRKALRDRMPTATATFQVMRDESPVVDEILRLPLVSMMQRIEEMFLPWNPSTEVMLGLRHANFSDIDASVFREALANAFCHRDYTIMAPVSIQLDETGLTIASPGGFMRGVNLGNLLTVPPTPRNRRLADILKRCGYVERTGRGLDRIVAKTVAAGRPFPDYTQSTADRVVLFLRKKPVNEDFVRMIDALTVRRGSRLPTESLITLASLSEYGPLNMDGIAAATSLDKGRIAQALADLTSLAGVSERRYGTGEPVYEITEPWAAQAKETNGHRIGHQTGHPDASAITPIPTPIASEIDIAAPGIITAVPTSTPLNAETLLAYMRNSGNEVSVNQVAEHFGKSYSTASRLLKRLLAEGRVRHQGSARSSRYYPAPDGLASDCKRT